MTSKTKTSRTDPAEILDQIRVYLAGSPLPSVSAVAATSRNPFRILISTMISLRTRDEVTLAATERLFSEAQTVAALADLSEARIARAIFPAGFYRTKARNIREVARIVHRKYGGEVPDGIDELTALPGVGRKTANLVLGLGFGIPAICVDTHVHRIANRLGWITTRNPNESELRLQQILPTSVWIKINELLVLFGQRVCTPQSPRCSSCPVAIECPRIGVTRGR